ncbi:Oxidation resistance protein 1 [Fusarium oxysporum f. sp. albedinis]|nr:Oxidation resistance protein 1 [Fusarium oxysporum f. sp. albedinis]
MTDEKGVSADLEGGTVGENLSLSGRATYCAKISTWPKCKRKKQGREVPPKKGPLNTHHSISEGSIIIANRPLFTNESTSFFLGVRHKQGEISE